MKKKDFLDLSKIDMPYSIYLGFLFWRFENMPFQKKYIHSNSTLENLKIFF